MKSFWRIFKYVRPQWPRVVLIVVTAVIIGVLFSLSFATIVPLLKVMMGEEGLHGWVDRKVCGWRYGMEFDVPDAIDLTNSGDAGIAYYVFVTNVKKDSAAEIAGLKRADKIIGAGSVLVGEDTANIVFSRLLEEMATADPNKLLELQIRRDNQKGEPVRMQFQLDTGKKPAFIDWAQDAVGFVPRGEAKAGKEKAIIFIIVLMGAVTLIRCVATFCQKYFAEKVVQVSLAGLREDVFAHVMDLPVGFLSTEGSSDTISRIVNDVAGIGKGVKILLGKALREPLKAIGTLTLAMMLSYKLTLIFLSCAPITIGLGVLLGKKIKKHTRRSLVSSAVMLGRLQGVIHALRVVKVYNRQYHERLAYHEVNRRFLKQTLRIAKIDAATGPIMEVLGMVAGSGALLVGVYWVTRAHMDPSSFFGLLVALGVTAETIRKTSDIWNKIQGANAAAERVYEVIDEAAEYEATDAFKLPNLKERIEFRNVVFTYPKADKPALKQIDLTIQAGHNVAVVGPNGSGKTTLVNLIPRFYNVDSGDVLIDGKNIRDASLKSLRNQISMVTQNVVTFNDSVAANIGYGKPNASLEEIIDAAKRSFAHEFIEPLPEGYASFIGEHGSGFSGGQLQRIVIARAILKDPAILIFDEAMSQVDADSEAKIHKALAELMHDRTCFIVAHRFSTVISADMIVVMDGGRIVAQGQHEELMKSCQLYRNLYETQLIIPD